MMSSLGKAADPPRLHTEPQCALGRLMRLNASPTAFRGPRGKLAAPDSLSPLTGLGVATMSEPRGRGILIPTSGLRAKQGQE
ncbi:hypothetical protein AAFF_G00086790 [Aldrovandia affinis]|uniref:Uncharacterized protein n=1 Tax=Aldrovandia affinis TaxID=143900 RepID=A0AAD7RWT6_9TELE|nr:hypothetical protein AAFF_G00086790 [Aldrovandia affinis]